MDGFTQRLNRQCNIELDKYEIRFWEQERELFPYPPIESIINFNFKFLSIGNISSKKITLRIPSKKQ